MKAKRLTFKSGVIVPVIKYKVYVGNDSFSSGEIFEVEGEHPWWLTLNGTVLVSTGFDSSTQAMNFARDWYERPVRFLEV